VTDGVIEATSPSGEVFSRERTASALARARALGPRGAVREVVDSLLTFGEGAPRDAATVLALRFDR
jgi:serine phosphatase RsbU (regulator of sigma subunit)